MQLFVDSLAVHNLGDFTVSETRDFEGSADAPQRAKVTLKIALEVAAETYADNRGLLEQLQLTLKQQNANLRWRNDETAQDYVNQTVTLVSSELPDDPSAWGQYAQQLTFTVYYYLHDLVTQNLPLEFAPATGEPLRLTHVAEWSESTVTERVSPLRKERQLVQRKLTVSGYILADVRTALAARRTALLAKKVELDRLNQTEATLRFGNNPNYVINRLVRVDEFTCTVNQMVTRLEWSFTAHYNLFPDETNYALIDYSVDERDGQTGEQFLTLSGRINAATEAAARTKLDEVTAALRAQYGYTTAQALPEQTTARRHTADADGDVFIELSFTREFRRWRTDNQQATFKKTGSATAVSLGEVRDWVMDYQAARVSDLRSQRQQASGRIEAAGTIKGDPTKPLAERRVELLAKQLALQNEVNAADGVLVYGTAFEQIVRVETFKAVINQAITGIEWQMTAAWSRFPNEADYATAEFNVAQRDSAEEGEETLAFAGRIFAPNRATATAKLAALRTSVLALYGYTESQRIGGETSAQNYFANGDKTEGITDADWADGTTFLELTFNETYRRRATAVSWSLKTSIKDETSTGLVSAVFSGWVQAGGASMDAAYDAARAKMTEQVAAALGRAGAQVGQEPFLKSQQVAWDIRQTRSDNGLEFLRLEFSHEYQGTLSVGRGLVEVTTALVRDTGGADVEQVNGVVVAADLVTASTIYQQQVRGDYTGRQVRNERLATPKTLAQTGANSWAEQQVRLEFSFEVYLPKLSGAASLRYSIATSLDYLAAERSARVSGSCFAVTRAAADTALNILANLAGGSLLRQDRTEDREWLETAPQPVGEKPGRFIKLDFDDVYVDRLTGMTEVLEMRLVENVTYSGDRLVVQPTLKNTDGSGGYSVVQAVSVQEGARVVRGSVTALTKDTAVGWAKLQRGLLTGTYRQPEEWETEYEFLPRVAGVVSGTGANVRLYRVSFTFAEILPNNPAPA